MRRKLEQGLSHDRLGDFSSVIEQINVLRVIDASKLLFELILDALRGGSWTSLTES
jgi:hypothetical protein